MDERIQTSIFAVNVVETNEKQQFALMAVYIQDKSFEHTLFTYTPEAGGEVTVHMMYNSAPSVITRLMLNIYKSFLRADVEFNQKTIGITDLKHIHIIKKIDTPLTTIQDFLPIKLVDKEYTADARTLLQYLTETFTIDSEITEPDFSCEKTTFAAQKDTTDYNLFWDSDKITNEEKALASPELNADILMSNYNRDTFHIFNKILTSNYPNKKYHAISLHGNPASGKTEMVKAWCSFNHVPLLTIPCDNRTFIDRLLSQVGPVSVSEDNNRVELMKIESLWLKCLKFNLPIVVFFDEANLLTTDQQNALSQIISDGNFKEGVNTYRNNLTIRWILAYNPNTTNTKSFDGKFYDRLNFIHVEDVALDDIKKYEARKTIASMIPTERPDITKFIDDVTAITNEHPEQKAKCDNIISIIKRCSADSSKESLEWIFKLLTTNDIQSQNKFSCKYLGDVKPDTPERIANAMNVIRDFVINVNIALMNQTKGKDTKNPDRSAYFHVTGRSLDVFKDYIYSYGNVETALHRFIIDLIPGGFTVRGQSVPSDALVDPTPQLIADTIVENLSGKINELDNILFTKIPTECIQDAATLFLSSVYVKSLWEKEEPEDSNTATSQSVSQSEGGMFEEINDIVTGVTKAQHQSGNIK